MASYFYIAHAEAQEIIETDQFREQGQKDEDIEFLKASQDGEKVALGPEDKTYGHKIKKKQ